MSILGDQLPVLGLGLFNGLALCLVDVYAPPTPRSQGFVGLTKSSLLTSTLWITSRITTDATLRQRIDRLGGNATLERFRIDQVLSILVGMIVAGGLAGLLSAQRG